MVNKFVDIVNLIMTFVCMMVVDRAGRRILMLIGLVGMCLSSVGLALFLTLITSFPDNTALSVVAIIFAVAFIVFFAIGPGQWLGLRNFVETRLILNIYYIPGAIPWLITGELFDSSARAKAGTIACFTNWTCNSLVTFLFPAIQVLLKKSFFLGDTISKCFIWFKGCSRKL